MSEIQGPAAVVQRQLDAYNARDVDGLLDVYARDAEMFEFPSRLVASGTEALRERFEIRFREPNLHARLLSRMVSGNRVVDHEVVHRTFPEGAGTIELIMIYEVGNGRIIKAWMIPGPQVLDSNRS